MQGAGYRQEGTRGGPAFLHFGSNRVNGQRPLFLLRGPDGDFNVMPESHEKFHEAPDGKVARSVSHQQGDLWLTYTKNFGGRDLRHTRGFEDCIDL